MADTSPSERAPSAPSSRRSFRATWLAFAWAIALSAVAVAVAPSFVWNLSPSLPRGLYLRDRGAAPRRGALVSFAPPARVASLIAARAYLPPGASLLKIVVALPGDTVELDERSFSVNGQRLGPVAPRDSRGRDLTPFVFTGTVPDGVAFVATTAPLSFDSRYFGPVPISSLTVVVPVWTY
jgi:conjugative transfer signal peptidase TraF